MTSRSDSERLVDILDRIRRIEYAEILLLAAEEDQESWEEAEVAFDAILYDRLVIGEAVKALSAKFKKAHEFIQWSQIAGMRNILTHEYFRVDGKIVRATIDKPLRELKQLCESEGQNS